ncbi:MAG: nodulation protein NfeD [Acidiferrobacterales bacterium]
MKTYRIALFVFMIVASLAGYAALTQTASSSAVILELNGPIGPASADYIKRGLKRADELGANLVIIRLDTPGGLDISMREIIQDILASPVPVATYVSPSGARAASAGTFILYASHIAAMAPGTNLGAATPVRIGGVPGAPEPPIPGKGKTGKDEKKPAGDAMERKVLNDAIAYIRSLAQMRGRNVAWAEKAVRAAASLPAKEAVAQNVVDLMADNITQLLQKIDGRKVVVGGQSIQLSTKGLSTRLIEPGWRYEFLATITNPNVLPILMMLGVFGLFYELLNPGFVLPGVIGGISLLLGLYASQVLPVNYAGLALILLGIMFMVAEAFVPSFGALGIGGVVAFVAGSVMLIDTDVEGYQVSWPAILGTAVFGALAFGSVAMLAAKAYKRRVVSGREEMIGSTGEALEAFDRKGRVRVHSEEWQAQSDQPLQAGQAIKVKSMKGLTLFVEPAEKEEH